MNIYKVKYEQEFKGKDRHIYTDLVAGKTAMKAILKAEKRALKEECEGNMCSKFTLMTINYHSYYEY